MIKRRVGCSAFRLSGAWSLSSCLSSKLTLDMLQARSLAPVFDGEVVGLFVVSGSMSVLKEG